MGFFSMEADSVLLTRLGGLKRTLFEIVSRVKGARTGHLEGPNLIFEAL